MKSSEHSLPAQAGLVAGRGTTRAQMAALEYRILEIVTEHSPQSVRQIFYRCLETNGAAYVAKADGYRKVQRAVLNLRRRGVIPWYAIIDATRTARSWDNGFDNVAVFVSDMAEHFRLDFWGQRIGKHVEIWTESRGFAGSIERKARDWRCTLVAFGGQPSDSLLYECAERINKRRFPTLVIYCGDLDPHGLLIEEAPRRKLREQWDCQPDWTRLLVTPQQIETYSLPTDETGKVVQAEAFPLPEVFKLIDGAFSSIADYDEIRELIEVEKEMYAELTEAADNIMGGWV